ncbi:hypothetical protein NMY22_g8096 [Coprinellus aureogranulatus]|nr:hypothetical protein NMY22_g8096 [Coprinellus aureogranulatus]
MNFFEEERHDPVCHAALSSTSRSHRRTFPDFDTKHPHPDGVSHIVHPTSSRSFFILQRALLEVLEMKGHEDLILSDLSAFAGGDVAPHHRLLTLFFPPTRARPRLAPRSECLLEFLTLLAIALPGLAGS